MAVTASHRLEPIPLSLARIVIEVGRAVVLRPVYLPPGQYGVIGVVVADEDALVVAAGPQDEQKQQAAIHQIERGALQLLVEH